MKGLSLTIVVVLCMLAGFVFADDIGGSIQNNSVINLDLQSGGPYTASSLFSQNNKVDLWYNLNVSDAFRFTGRLGWIFRREDGTADFYYNTEGFNALELLKSLEILKIRGDIPSAGDGLKMLSYQAGRYRVSDASGYILNGTLDGLDVNLRYAGSSFKVGLWYNGFIDKKLSTILLTRADTNSYLDPVKVFAAPRLVQYLELKFHDLGGQSLVFFVCGQQDIYSSSRLETLDGGHYYSAYLGADINGVVAPNLYYGLTGIFNGGLYRFPASESNVFQVAQLLAAHGTYAFGGDLLPVLRGRIVYTSGDDWDRSDWEGSTFTAGTAVTTMFVPISANTFGFIYRPKLGNLGFLELQYSIKPSRKFQILLTNRTFLRSLEGPLSLDTASDVTGRYLGDEVSLGFNFKPFSDVGFSTVCGLYYPNEKLVTSNGIDFRMDVYVSVDY